MKAKILLTLTIFFSFVITTNAQFNKGSIFLGGGVNYTNNTSSSSYTLYNTSYKDEIITTSVQIGKFVTTNTVVGLIGTYNNNNYKFSPGSDSNFNKTNAFSAGIFYRKYKKLLKDLYLFAEVDGVFTHSNNHQGTNYNNNGFDITVINNGATFSFVPGISYAITKKAQIELLMNNLASLTYTHLKQTNIEENPPVTSNESGHNFGAGVNINSNFLSGFGVGFKFIF